MSLHDLKNGLVKCLRVFVLALIILASLASAGTYKERLYTFDIEVMPQAQESAFNSYQVIRSNHIQTSMFCKPVIMKNSYWHNCTTSALNKPHAINSGEIV